MARAAPELSPSFVRLLDRPRPSWRGRLHRWAAAASVPVGIGLVVLAGGTVATYAALVFAVGITTMFGVSAAVHWRAWPSRRYHRLIQLDHTAIFVCCAATATPVALLALDGGARVALMVGMWLGVAIGVVLEWLPFHPPRGVMNTMFLTLGWYPVLFLPALWRGMDGVTFALMVAGGLVYTVGAIVVGAQRPDPSPGVFGYHEVWHLLVIVAVALHCAMVLRLVR
jgi:hemolysin III